MKRATRPSSRARAQIDIKAPQRRCALAGLNGEVFPPREDRRRLRTRRDFIRPVSVYHDQCAAARFFSSQSTPINEELLEKNKQHTQQQQQQQQRQLLFPERPELLRHVIQFQHLLTQPDSRSALRGIHTGVAPSRCHCRPHTWSKELGNNPGVVPPPPHLTPTPSFLFLLRSLSAFNLQQ